jgi:hypothetical protein
MNKAEPSASFAGDYLLQAKEFVAYAKQVREQLVLKEKV